MNQLKSTWLAVLGGACGGAVVGLAEATLVASTSSPEEFWMFPFALLAYGAFGVAAGIGAAVWVALLGATTARRPTPLGWGVFLAFAPLAFAIGRYHVMQRVFQEGVPLSSPTGFAVHLGLVAAAVIFGAILARVVRGAAARPGLLVGGLALALAVATGGAWLAGEDDGGSIERRAKGASSDLPNVILVVIDTLRDDAVEAHIDRGEGGIGKLARDGVRFTNAHSQASWTRPSVASLLTSLYPSQHGTIYKTSFLPDSVTTLAEAMSQRGYWTAGFTTNINLAPIFNFQQGFDEYRYLEPSFYFGATDSATRLAIYKGLRVLREWLFRDRIYFQNYYQDAEVVGDALGGWLAENPPQPFFLLVHYMDPHDPYFEMPYNGHGVARVVDPDPPADRAEAYHALYGEGVSYIEAHLGGILDQLQERGLYDNSVIAVTSDHGEEFQDHGGWWHGTTLYQEQVHVPLVIKQAGSRTVPAVDDKLVETLDVAPTLMRAAGLEPPAAFVGHDILGTGTSDDVFSEEDHEGNRITALRRGDWKIIVANPDNPRGLAPVELYNLAVDPEERNNLAATEGGRVEAMMQALSDRRAAIRRGAMR